MKAQDRNIKQALLQIANGLPFNYTIHPASRMVSGKELLEANPEAKDKDGTEIDPNKKYIQNGYQKQFVNHYRRLKRIYASGGWPAVDHYCKEVFELEQPQIKTIGGIPIESE